MANHAKLVSYVIIIRETPASPGMNRHKTAEHQEIVRDLWVPWEACASPILALMKTMVVGISNQKMDLTLGKSWKNLQLENEQLIQGEDAVVAVDDGGNDSLEKAVKLLRDVY